VICNIFDTQNNAIKKVVCIILWRGRDHPISERKKLWTMCKCVPQLIKSASFALPNKKKGIQDGSAHVNKSSDQTQSRCDFSLAGG
jgi:hypothetical protein